MLYPKIGIRPVIDGRWGGVRESLEAQTMAMAENAAKLISENLKYPDGVLYLPVFRAIPHKDCACIAQSDFSSDCTMRTTQG